MPVVFVIPGPLREFAGNHDEVTVDGAPRDVAGALSMLWEEWPGLRDRLLNELGEVRPHVNIFVDGECIRYCGGLDAAVRDGSEVVIVPALSGG